MSADRIKYLEARVAELEAEVDELKDERDELVSQMGGTLSPPVKKKETEGWPTPAPLPENYWETAE